MPINSQHATKYPDMDMSYKKVANSGAAIAAFLRNDDIKNKSYKFRMARITNWTEIGTLASFCCVDNRSITRRRGININIG
jgi:hypothetical protein